MHIGAHQLDHFLAVLEHGSITRAADRLNLTQPALAKSIKRLEEILGVELFERLPRGVEPTVFGRSLARHAKFMQAELRHAMSEIAAMRDARRGRLVIGAGATVVGGLLPQAIAAVLSHRPDVSFHVVTGLIDELFDGLREGDIDVVIGAIPQPASDPEIESLALIRYDLKVTARAGHPLGKRSPIGLPDLLAYPWVLIGRNRLDQRRLEEVFVAHGLQPPVPVVETDSFAYAIAHLAASDCLSYQASLLVQDRDLVTFDVPDLAWARIAGVSWRRRGSLPPISMPLIAELQRICRTLLPGAAIPQKDSPAS